MRRRTYRSRGGFSLTDLLVILGCVGVAGSLLAPALGKAQEADNRLRCMNNLKQIALATHNYHSDFNRLPPGYIGPMDKGNGPVPTMDKPEESLNVGVLVLLLPYLEQDRVYKQFLDAGMKFDLKGHEAAWWKQNDNLQTARIALQKLFRCPSDPWDDKPSEGTLAAFHCTEGKMQQHTLPGTDATSLGRSNYAGVAGMWGRSEHPFARAFAGLLSNRSKLTFGQVTVMDGTSNTLMFGEGVGGLPRAKRDTAWSWTGVGAMVTVYGLAPEPSAKGAFRFGSRHEKVVQFAMGDGSARALRFAKTAEVPDPLPNSVDGLKATDWLIFQQLAGYRDGLNHDTSGIIE